MSFSNVIGQQRAKQALRQALENGRLAHAILFYGPEGVGKKALAIELAKAVNCTHMKNDACDQCSPCRKISALQHPDVKVIFPEPVGLEAEDEIAVLQRIAKDNYQPIGFERGVIISIDKIRELRREMSYYPYEGKRKVAILLEADQMRPEAANALLKILEEPPGSLLLILTATNVDSLLPTILSRCQKLRLAPLSKVEIEGALLKRKNIPLEKAKVIAALANGSLTRALLLAEEENVDEYRENTWALLNTAVWGKGLEKLDLVESIVAEKNKTKLDYLLEFLLLWLRDALLWNEGHREEITNIDHPEKIEKLARRLHCKEIERLTQQIDFSLEMLSRNVNAELILMGLMQQAYRLG